MTETPAALTATGITGFAGRAIAAAQAYCATDSTGFHQRHDNPLQWQRWVRRCRVTRTVATALQVPVSWVTVTDDPQREHHALGRRVPGDLITVTDPQTGHAWRFIPDHTTPGDGWLLIDNCPACDAEIPATRIASLADLGEYLDPTARSGPQRTLTSTPRTNPAARSTSKPPTNQQPRLPRGTMRAATA